MKHFVTLIICVSLAMEASAQVSLFHPVTGRVGLETSLSEPGVLRNGYVQITGSVVNDLATTAPGAQLRIAPFPGADFIVSLDRKSIFSDQDDYTWTGHVKGQPLATFNMSVSDEATAADLHLPDGITYTVRYRGNGIHEVREIAEDALPACGVGPRADLDLSLDAMVSHIRDESAPTDTPDEIDVLVAYTQDAETQAGGPSGMTTLINQAFTLANNSYANSQIPLTIVKRATIKVNYTPNVDMGLDLSRLRSTTDGYMDEVHAARDAYGADMVCLLRGSSSPAACGIAYLMQSNSTGFAPNSFAVCANNCVSGQTFAHELGHNMGCHHDQANSGSTPVYPYAYGWRWYGGPTQYRSVMAYAPGNRVQHFSSPEVNYAGAPTGVDNVADNARTIRNTAPSVANFRQRVTPSAPVLMCSAATITVNIPVSTDGSQVVQFGNAGAGSLNYSLSDNLSWLTVSPPTGSAAALISNPHTLAFDSDSMAIGQYTGSITMANDETTATKAVPVVVNIYQPVLNDHFANAQLISDANGFITGSNRYATRQSGEANSVASRVGQHSIWYKWVAPSNMPVTFDTIGSSFDTLLAAYTGSLGALSMKAENDNGTGISTRSRITFTPVQGTTYYILIDAGNNVMGNTTLNWASEASVQDWAEF